MTSEAKALAVGARVAACALTVVANPPNKHKAERKRNT